MPSISKRLHGYVIYRFKHDELERVQTELEEVLNTPFVSNMLGRFLKVSDIGIKQELKITRELVKRDNARKILEAKDAITKLLNKETMTADDWLAIAAKPDTFDRNFVQMIARKYSNAIAEELISVQYTGSVEQRIAVWKKIQEMNLTLTPSEDYRWIWQRDKSQHKKEWTWEEVPPDAKPRR